MHCACMFSNNSSCCIRDAAKRIQVQLYQGASRCFEGACIVCIRERLYAEESLWLRNLRLATGVTP